MVELVDTQVSEACPRKGVEVQIFFRAPNTLRVFGEDMSAGGAGTNACLPSYWSELLLATNSHQYCRKSPPNSPRANPATNLNMKIQLLFILKRVLLRTFRVLSLLAHLFGAQGRFRKRTTR